MSNYKIISMLKRKPDESHADFKHYWLNVHAPLAKELPGLVRYIQNHIVSTKDNGENKHCVDGFVELWFESEVAMKAAFASSVGKKLRMDEGNFIGQLSMVAVEEQVIIP